MVLLGRAVLVVRIMVRLAVVAVRLRIHWIHDGAANRLIAGRKCQ
jgi:hypothetical protein